MQRIRVVVAVLVVWGLAFVVMPVASGAETAGCTDFYLMAARGSGQADGGYVDGPTGKAGMGAEMYSMMSPLRDRIESHDASVTMMGVQYRAVSVANGASTITGLRKALRVGGAYNDSVAGGVQWVSDAVEAIVSRCPEARLVMGGYSQGAETMGRAVQGLPARLQQHVAAVGLVADPLFNSTDWASNYSTFEANHNGAFGPRPVWDIGAPVFSYCHYGDPICNISLKANLPTGGWIDWYDFSLISATASALGGGLFGQHTNYDGNWEIPDATERILGVLDLPGPMRPLVAEFATPHNATLGSDAHFSAAGSRSDYRDPITSYSWSWGDGETTESDTNWLAHTYRSAGDFTVTLTVTTDSGDEQTVSKSVHVVDLATLPPAAPTVRRQNGDGEITLSWPAVPFASGYRITTADGAHLDAFDFPGERVTWSDVGLANGDDYRYCVIAVNAVGESDPTCIGGTPYAPFDPLAPVSSTVRLFGPEHMTTTLEGVSEVSGGYSSGYVRTDDGAVYHFSNLSELSPVAVSAPVMQMSDISGGEAMLLREDGVVDVVSGGVVTQSGILIDITEITELEGYASYAITGTGQLIAIKSTSDIKPVVFQYVGGGKIVEFAPWEFSEYLGGVALTNDGRLFWVVGDQAYSLPRGGGSFTSVAAGYRGSVWALDDTGGLWGIKGDPSLRDPDVTSIRVPSPVAAIVAAPYAETALAVMEDGGVYATQCTDQEGCSNVLARLPIDQAVEVQTYATGGGVTYVLDARGDVHRVEVARTWTDGVDRHVAPTVADTVVLSDVTHLNINFGLPYALTREHTLLWSGSGQLSTWEQVPLPSEVTRLTCSVMGACFVGMR